VHDHPAVTALAARQDGLVTTAQALSAGMGSSDIRTLVRRREWLTLTRGVHLVDADLFGDGLNERTWWRAALLSQGSRSFLVADTAVRAFGISGLPADPDTIEVGVPYGFSRMRRGPVSVTFDGDIDGPTIVVRQLVVPAEQVVAVDGLAARAAAPSLVDAALNRDRATALCLLDSALHLGAVTTDELAAAVVAAEGRRGVVALRELAAYADPRAESPLESRVRLACIDAGVGPDELQLPVRDERGYLVAIGDMAWLNRRSRPLIGEADGAAVHSQPEAVFRDRRRGNALAALGYDTVRFTWADALQPRRIVAAVKAALRAA
jgi:hypothetical protein